MKEAIRFTVTSYPNDYKLAEWMAQYLSTTKSGAIREAIAFCHATLVQGQGK